MTDEIDLNIDDAIKNMTEPEPKEDSDFECETVESGNTMTTHNEALKVISDLKNFASGNYIAFQHIKNLEDYFRSCFLKQKISNMRQSSILEFVNK